MLQRAHRRRGLAGPPIGNTARGDVMTPHLPNVEGVELEGVSETLLWTLYRRASEAARSDRVLHDPMAVELVKAIDFPFEERFGATDGWAQWQALRARNRRRRGSRHPQHSARR
jgi:O-methyltransferase involved in polyketide biosynthesis